MIFTFIGAKRWCKVKLFFQGGSETSSGRRADEASSNLEEALIRLEEEQQRCLVVITQTAAHVEHSDFPKQRVSGFHLTRLLTIDAINLKCWTGFTSFVPQLL